MSSILDNYFKTDKTRNSINCGTSLRNNNCSYYINCNYANKLYSYLKTLIEPAKDTQNQEYNRIYKETIIACNNLINKRRNFSSIDTLLNRPTQLDIDKNIIYKIKLLIDNIDISNLTIEAYKKLLEDYTKKYGNLLLNNYDTTILKDLKLKISKLVESIPENISFINPIFDINYIIIEVISNDKKINNKGSIIQINYKTKTFNIEYNNSIIIPNIPFDNLCIENIEIAPYAGYPDKNISLITGSTKTKSITPLCEIIINCTNVKKLKEKLEYHLSYKDANKQSNLYIGTFLKILKTSTSMLSSYTAHKVFHLLSNITTDNTDITTFMTNYHNIYNSKPINLHDLQNLIKIIYNILNKNISQITIKNPIFNDKEIQIIYKNNNKSYNGYITQINLYTIPPTFIFEYEINSKNKSVIENPPNFSSLCIKSDRIYERYNKCITELEHFPVSILLYNNNNGVNKEVNHVINTGSYYNESTFRPSCRYFINCRDAEILKKNLIEFKEYENNNEKFKDEYKIKFQALITMINNKNKKKYKKYKTNRATPGNEYKYTTKYINHLTYFKNVLSLIFDNIQIEESDMKIICNEINKIYKFVHVNITKDYFLNFIMDYKYDDDNNSSNQYKGNLNILIEQFTLIRNITFINPVISNTLINTTTNTSTNTPSYKLSIKIKSKFQRNQHKGEMITINLQNNTFNAWNLTTKQIIRDIPFTQLCIKSNDDKPGTECYDSLRDK